MTHHLRRAIASAAVVGATLFATAPVAGAQALREIGRTAAGNPVLVEQRTVKRDGSAVSATVRVRFAKAVRAPGGDWWSSRTRLTLDCSRRQVKVLENWYFGDTTWRRIASHNTPGTPAFGTVMGGSMTSVAHDALCPAR
ncbi:MAG: surface-adhesin E family protein [Gemmatimonadota bacterium]